MVKFRTSLNVFYLTSNNFQPVVFSLTHPFSIATCSGAIQVVLYTLSSFKLTNIHRNSNSNLKLKIWLILFSKKKKKWNVVSLFDWHLRHKFIQIRWIQITNDKWLCGPNKTKNVKKKLIKYSFNSGADDGEIDEKMPAWILIGKPV